MPDTRHSNSAESFCLQSASSFDLGWYWASLLRGHNPVQYHDVRTVVRVSKTPEYSTLGGLCTFYVSNLRMYVIYVMRAAEI
jgi:hypothetical protein